MCNREILLVLTILDIHISYDGKLCEAKWHCTDL